MIAKWVKILLASTFFGTLFFKKNSKKNDLSAPSESFNDAFKSEKNIQFVEIDESFDFDNTNKNAEEIDQDVQSPG